ncbi:hypothetical protein D3C78_1836540 [compost metagenome]
MHLEVVAHLELTRRLNLHAAAGKVQADGCNDLSRMDEAHARIYLHSYEVAFLAVVRRR